MYQLLKLGVSLTEQGIPEAPALLLDWLPQIDAVVAQAQAEVAEAERRKARGA